jgi:hypothetical protein
LASADVRREAVSGLLRLSRLSLSRRVWFTNRFTELITDLPVCYPSRHVRAHADLPVPITVGSPEGGARDSMGQGGAGGV